VLGLAIAYPDKQNMSNLGIDECRNEALITVEIRY